MPHADENNKEMELPDYSAVLQETEQVLKQCFDQYKLDEVFLAFNGGKDCTILLDITINLLQTIHNRDDVAKDLKTVYIRTNGPFNEIEQFAEEVEKHYGLKLEVTEGSIKETLSKILEKDTKLKACLMGTRRTDPYCKDLMFMQKTDPDWPQVIRVSPLLEWSYHQIWSYILQRNVPYCSLYDAGYTSIGSVHNTWPNPSLAYKDACGCLSYHPAWKLIDGSLERAGRGAPASAPSNGHGSEKTDECRQNGDA